MLPHRKDTLFSKPLPASKFEFNTQVADVFDDMIQRSVPGYGFLLDVVSVLASRYGQHDSVCYDLGCSLGTATARLRQNLPDSCHVIGVDNSEAMVKRCQQNLHLDNNQVSYEILHQDIQTTEITNASIVIVNFTLQFILEAERQDILNQIYVGLRPGGVLLLAEKMSFESVQQQQLHTDLYHSFKKYQGYSNLEVAQKRAALENVLIPNTEKTHRQRLAQAGFIDIQTCMQCFNFFALLAFKSTES